MEQTKCELLYEYFIEQYFRCLKRGKFIIVTGREKIVCLSDKISEKAVS